ncbi:MAG: hypothetical protein JWP30_1241 [Homoserinimonas sp.]|nr:hypothetical protein [Homoserinimonas sp.]
MRFVAAIISFVIAFVMIAFGLAERTLFAQPDHVTSAVAVESTAPITIIDGDTLNARDGRQKIELAGDGAVFAAYGRTSDVIAWAGDTSYNMIGLDEETGRLTSSAERGKSNEAPPAAGSDLWLGEYQREGELTFTINVPQDISIIVMSDGVQPAPSSVQITWPVDNRTPWSGPLIVGGVLMLLLGLGLYLWALNHLRKTRGPRRKPPKQPKQPKLPGQPRYNYRKAVKAVRANKPKAIESAKGRRSSRRMTAVIPVMLVTGLVLSGCSVQSSPFNPQQAAPTPTATVAQVEGDIAKEAAVTVPQAEDIIGKVSAVATQADAELNPDLATSRFAGAALELRTANYAIRKVDPAFAAPKAIPAGPVKLVLPQQSDTWPRTVLAVIQDPANEEVIPTALMLKQDTPRENYKVHYAVVLESNIVLPDVASATVGAVRVAPDDKLRKMSPATIATAYADILALGADSAYYEQFDLENDVLVPSAGVEGKAARKAALPPNASITTAGVAGVGETIALATSESGALVTASIGEVETVTPTEAGSQLTPDAGPVKSLSGVTTTTKGVAATYAFQLLFYVPPASSNEKISLLGFSEGLVAAKEI